MTLEPSLKPHWFYKKSTVNGKNWYPFSLKDSDRLEEVFQGSKSGHTLSQVVSTDGGRYDVYLDEKVKKAIYWDEVANEVRRSTWFHQKPGENFFIPYNQEFTYKLEKHFQRSIELNQWDTRIELTNGEVIVFYNSKIMMHFPSNCPIAEDWTSVTDNLVKPDRIIRGVDELNIEKGEEDLIDHLVFVVHGVGSICDFKFRPLVEVVDDFRNMVSLLMTSHFLTDSGTSKVGRIEFLPIQWHSHLHSETTGIDNRLKLITLQSIPKLRNFSNDTILDAFCYTSPIYCQYIVDAVGSELNRLFKLFKSRNPTFTGSIGLVGHSLGSLIVFDILSHQHCVKESSDSLNVDKLSKIKDVEMALEFLNLKILLPVFKRNQINYDRFLELEINDLKNFGLVPRNVIKVKDLIKKLRQNQKMTPSQEASDESDESRRASTSSIFYNHKPIETIYSSIKFPQLDFKPLCFFALGSPIAMFLTVRGIESLGDNYKLPTCDYMYNIFHPFDPIAYRLEPLINSNFANFKPAQIPHHKGRKRLHLELKDNLTKFGSDLKQVVQSWKVTWNSILSRNTPNERAKEICKNEIESELEPLKIKVAETQDELNIQDFTKSASSRYSAQASEVIKKEFHSFGILNNGRRVDFVLQEKPIEFINEYLFAVASHACYWRSEDTALLIINEMYNLNGVEMPTALSKDYESVL